MKISLGTSLERSLFQNIALGSPASISSWAVTVLFSKVVISSFKGYIDASHAE